MIIYDDDDAFDMMQHFIHVYTASYHIVFVHLQSTCVCIFV